MQSTEVYFNKAKKDFYKFVKSQETKTDKFYNKDLMLKKLILVSIWIIKRMKKNKTLIIGLAGGQGTGKTTISSILKLILVKSFSLNVFKISIDDFYKSRKERIKMSKLIHPLLVTRGVPGTHDTNYIIDFFKKLKGKKFSTVNLPKFDKSIDDRVKKNRWYKIKSRPDIVILEGWCVGASPQKKNQLLRPINILEKKEDNLLKWRKYVNFQLKNKYKKFHKMLDCFLYLKAKNFSMLKKWRLKQERKLVLNSKNKKNLKIMNKNEVLRFMMTYQRITEHMFKTAERNASIVMKLNNKHQILNIKYK